MFATIQTATIPGWTASMTRATTELALDLRSCVTTRAQAAAVERWYEEISRGMPNRHTEYARVLRNVLAQQNRRNWDTGKFLFSLIQALLTLVFVEPDPADMIRPLAQVH